MEPKLLICYCSFIFIVFRQTLEGPNRSVSKIMPKPKQKKGAAAHFTL